MIDPLPRSRIVPIPSPLPPAWIRVAPTHPDPQERIGTSLYRVGPDRAFRTALIDSIDNAHEVILIASFLLSDEELANAMVRAAKRGRRVYVLTASETRLDTTVDKADEFTARMVEEHKRLLNRLVDHVVLRSAGHFHAKMLVCDPGTAPVGWVSTANFNRALLDSVEIGFKVSEQAAVELAAWFNWAFWMEAEHELVEKGRMPNVGQPPAEPLRPQPGTIVATARDETSLSDEVVRLIKSAQHRLVVSSYGLDANHAAIAAIRERLSLGVPVTIITRPRPAVTDAVQHLYYAGATIRAHDKLHAKAIIADETGILMTANIQAHGLDKGFEVGVRLQGEDAAALADTLDTWATSFPWQFAANLNRSEHKGEICLAELGLRTGRRKVLKEKTVVLGTVTANSALDLQSAPEPDLPLPKEEEHLYQRVRYEWQVVPPRLPKGAKEIKRELTEGVFSGNGQKRMKAAYDPPAFSHEGETLVLLTKPEKTADAQRLAKKLNARVVIR